MSEVHASNSPGGRRNRPEPARRRVSVEEWRGAIEALAAGRLTLVELRGQADAVHMAVLDEAPSSVTLLSLDCPEGSYPSVSAAHAPAIRPERALRELTG